MRLAWHTTTYRIVKELYGDAYAQEHYIDQWQQAVDDYYLDFYVRNPDYLANLPEDKQLEITGNLTYVRQYCEMPLKILKAEQLEMYALSDFLIMVFVMVSEAVT